MSVRERHKGSTGPLIASLWQFSLFPPVPQDYSVLCTDFGETCCCVTTDPELAHGSRELSVAKGLLDHSSGVPGGSGGRATLPSQRSTLNVGDEEPKAKSGEEALGKER